MKHRLIRLAAVFALFSGLLARGNTLYVDLNSINPTPPYSDWSTAATNIQDAIDASSDGDQIWVTNGVYQTGGKVMGNLTNRVALTKAITVGSVNGPFVTAITGSTATNGPNAVRCAWLTNNAVLMGFTLTRGAAPLNGLTPSAIPYGGGAWCASSNASVISCVIVSNTAEFGGGAAYQGTLKNCFIRGNTTTDTPGSAIQAATVNDCTVVSNSRPGLSGCKATNSICYFNSGANYSGGVFSYCCVTPAAAGTGNFTNAPQFFSDGIHPSIGSPCVAAGTTTVTGVDLFGNAWGNPPTVGCAELPDSPLVSTPQVQLLSTPVGFKMTNVLISATGALSFSWLKDDVALQDDGHFSFTKSTNLMATGLNLGDAGNYQLVVGNASGMTTSSVAQVVVHCVNIAGMNSTPPYTNWETAATNIQDAIDSASTNEIVLVTNGVYSGGGKAMVADLTNRVVLDKAITVTSVNGYANTVIEGLWDPNTTNGPAAVRCAWLTNGATLNGFTLRNGATGDSNSTGSDSQYGGGALLYYASVLSNCELTNNSAYYAGGGISSGTANNCFFTHNSAPYGGAAAYANLNNCTLRENHNPPTAGGSAGSYECPARNCLIQANYTSAYGVVDYQLANFSSLIQDTFTNCCTVPPPSRGANNVLTADPGFLDVSNGFALSPASPCVSAGNPLFATGYDLDGEPYLNPPPIGCDQIVATNTRGPLSFSFLSYPTNALAYHKATFVTQFEGRPTELDWSFGEGPAVTNLWAAASHVWTNGGTYTVTLTAYNTDHPSGVSSNIVVTVDPFLSPSIDSIGIVSNAFQFNFLAQGQGLYRYNMQPI